jgi:hypothetical protein
MRYKTLITFAGILLAHVAWAASPIFEGASARIQLLDARVLDAPKQSGAVKSVRMVYLVTRQPGVVGKLALKEPRDVTIKGRSYRELTESELGRTFEPSTVITEAAKFFQEHSALKPEGAPESGALIIKVELPGAALPKDAEVQSKLSLGFGDKVEESTYSFTPKSQ